MKVYKKILILILFIIIILNYIYLKIAINHFRLKELGLSYILVIDSLLGGATLIFFAKGIPFYTKDESLENQFGNSKNEVDNKYEKLFDCIDVGYVYFNVIRDELGDIIDAKAIEVNKALIQIFEETRENMLSYSFSKFVKKFMGEKFEYLKIISKVQNEGKFKVSEYINANENIWITLSIHKMKNGDFAVFIIDVSERKKYIEEMRYLANYDSLTNLKNRYSIYNCLADLKRKKKKFAILFIDLDNFKALNDELGHDLGDTVLHKVALVLKKYENDLIKIGRLGGDEFLIIIEDDISKERIEEFGKTIVKSLNLSFGYKSYSYNIKASVGASVFNRDSDNIVTLIKYADIAMYHSKKQGGNMVSIFSGEMLENEIKKMC